MFKINRKTEKKYLEKPVRLLKQALLRDIATSTHKRRKKYIKAHILCVIATTTTTLTLSNVHIVVSVFLCLFPWKVY